EKRLHAFAEDDLAVRTAQAVLGREPRKVEDGVEHPPRAERRIVHPGSDPASGHYQGYVHRRLIDQIAVESLAMIAEPLTMIADEDHDGLPWSALLERLDDAPDLLVHGRHFTEVRRVRVLRSIGFWWCIQRMGVGEG